MNGDDITWSNSSMPYFPKEMGLFKRIRCLLGYHKKETRQTIKAGLNGLEMRKEPMKLRDQCGRCGTLL